MKKIKSWLIIAFFPLLAQISYAQKSDYIATDSSLISGIKLVQGTSEDNAQFIRLKRKNEKIKYYPNQLSEYGFKDGTKYFSKEIVIDGEERRVFLELLESGTMNLYYYKDEEHRTFFIEKDSVLIEMKEDKLAFKSLSENPSFISNAIRLANYSRKSMKKLVSIYNEGKKRPFPYRKAGVALGIKSTTLAQPTNLSQSAIETVTFSPLYSINIGFFTDLPIEMSNFSFNSGIFFTKTGYSENSFDSRSYTDVVVNLSSLNAPLLFRYTLPTIRLRPFLEVGGQVTYNIENSSQIYRATIEDDIIIINSPNQVQLMSDVMLGYMIGIGLQYNINYRKTLSFEIRQGTSYGKEGSLNVKGLDILIGFTF